MHHRFPRLRERDIERERDSDRERDESPRRCIQRPLYHLQPPPRPTKGYPIAKTHDYGAGGGGGCTSGAEAGDGSRGADRFVITDSEDSETSESEDHAGGGAGVFISDATPLLSLGGTHSMGVDEFMRTVDKAMKKAGKIEKKKNAKSVKRHTRLVDVDEEEEEAERSFLF